MEPDHYFKCNKPDSERQMLDFSHMQDLHSKLYGMCVCVCVHMFYFKKKKSFGGDLVQAMRPNTYC